MDAKSMVGKRDNFKNGHEFTSATLRAQIDGSAFPNRGSFLQTRARWLKRLCLCEAGGIRMTTKSPSKFRSPGVGVV
jgi:hypothetical protein